MIKNIIKTGFNIKVFDVDTKITKTLDKNKIISVIPDIKNVASVWKDLSYVLAGETVSNDHKFQQKVTGITISPKKSFCILKIWMSGMDYQNPRVITQITGLDIKGCLFKKHKPNY